MAFEEGMQIQRIHRAPEVPRLRNYEYFVTSIPRVAWHISRTGADLVHAFFPSLAWAAVKIRRIGGPPVVFSFHGIPARQYLVARRRRLEMLQQVIDGAALTNVLSKAAAKPFRRYLGHNPAIAPGGVNLDSFRSSSRRSETPCLICPASLGDPRKRGSLLLSAFVQLRTRLPSARLLLAGGADPTLSALDLELPEGVELIDAGDTEELARAYSHAWVCVLPSVGEAFGLVLLESMAAGTPVIAARSGAAPEIVRADVGDLFEPDDEADLIRIMEMALAGPPDRDVVNSCRLRAKEFDWKRVADVYENQYSSALAGA